MSPQVFISVKELNIVRISLILGVFSSASHMLTFKRVASIVIGPAFFKV